MRGKKNFQSSRKATSLPTTGNAPTNTDRQRLEQEVKKVQASWPAVRTRIDQDLTHLFTHFAPGQYVMQDHQLDNFTNSKDLIGTLTIIEKNVGRFRSRLERTITCNLSYEKYEMQYYDDYGWSQRKLRFQITQPNSQQKIFTASRLYTYNEPRHMKPDNQIPANLLIDSQVHHDIFLHMLEKLWYEKVSRNKAYANLEELKANKISQPKNPLRR